MHRMIAILVLVAAAALVAACNDGGSDGLATDDPFASPSTPVMTELPSALPSEEVSEQPS